MSTLADSYVSRVLFTSPTPGRVWGATSWRWRRLTTWFDPYPPELHYMWPRSKMAVLANAGIRHAKSPACGRHSRRPSGVVIDWVRTALFTHLRMPPCGTHNQTVGKTC